MMLLLLISLADSKVLSQPTVLDSTEIKKSWFVVPTLSYMPETSFAPGIAGGFYLKSPSLKRISNISYNVMYSLKHQFTFHVSPKIYLDKEQKYYLYSSLGVKMYPDTYYGRGNAWSGLKLRYTSRSAYLNLQPQYQLTDDLQLGLNASFRYENIHLDDSISQHTLDSVKCLYGTAGWDPYHQVGLGVMAAYDTRDSYFYPSRGVFAKASLAYYPTYLSTYSYGQFSLDYRHYVTTCFNQVLAWQILAEGVFGGDVPFVMLPTLGGGDVLRGFHRGVYSDSFSFAGQVEYRIPLFWRIKAAVFCATGDVLNWKDPHIEKLKFTYGLGLRLQINQARVHLRVDLARNNYDNGFQFYLTATEAF